MSRSRSKVFISYRRDGGAETARLIFEELKKRRFAPFMDVENLGSGPYSAALQGEIASATDVVVVLTPDCLLRNQEESDWFRREIAEAMRREKNIVPVMTESFDWPAQRLPPEFERLRLLNGLRLFHPLWQASMDQLVQRFLQARPPSRLAAAFSRVLRPRKPAPARSDSEPPIVEADKPEARDDVSTTLDSPATRPGPADTDASYWIEKARQSARSLGTGCGTQGGPAPEFWQGPALRKVAVAQADIGDIAGAKQTAQEIELIEEQVTALAEIAECEKRVGRLHDAEETARTVRAVVEHARARGYRSDRADRDRTFVNALARVGEVGLALKLAAKETWWRDRSHLLCDIAAARATDGDRDGALKTLGIVLEALPANVQRDFEIDAKESILRKIGVLAAEFGDRALARRIAGDLFDVHAKSAVLGAILVPQVQRGDAAGAMAEVARLDDALLKGLVRVSIGRAQVAADDVAGARRTLASARQDVAGAKCAPKPAIRALCRLAIADAEAGDGRAAGETLAQARRLIGEFNFSSEKNPCLREIAEAEVQLGEYAAALQTVSEVRNDDSVKRSIAEKIIDALIARRELTAVPEFAALDAHAPFRAHLLLKLLHAQVEVGDLAGAERTAAQVRSIVGPRDRRWEEEYKAAVAVARARAGAVGEAARMLEGVHDVGVYCEIAKIVAARATPVATSAAPMEL